MAIRMKGTLPGQTYVPFLTDRAERRLWQSGLDALAEGCDAILD